MSGSGLTFNRSGRQLMRAAQEATEVGARRGLEDVLDDWRRQAVDVAPIDTGNLRRQIKPGDISGSELNLDGYIEANAIDRDGDGTFNYAYYIHELNAGGKQLRAPGTIKKFLDKPAQDNERKWERWLSEEIEDELERRGW